MEIKVARYRNYPYIVNYDNGSSVKKYRWNGSKGSKHEVKSIPKEVVDHLVMNSQCFRQGELKIIDDTEEAKETIDNLDEKEEYEANTHSFEEAEKILKGNYKKMEKELQNITVHDEKKFFIEVAKEINLDSATKQKILADWYGVDRETLFSDE